MRLLWGMLICSNKQYVIVVSLVSLMWQLCYKVSVWQSGKWGCFWTQQRERAAASFLKIPVLSCVWSSGGWDPEVSHTALTYVSWLIFYLQAGSISQGSVPHQSFHTGDAGSTCLVVPGLCGRRPRWIPASVGSEAVTWVSMLFSGSVEVRMQLHTLLQSEHWTPCTDLMRTHCMP